jgi:hypothetical protein
VTNRDTIDRWLAARRPAPPPALRARLAEVLPAGAVGVDACLRAGEALLERLLEDDCASRGSALDLLVADALVTYAFEAAADEPTVLEARATAAMLEIAAIGEPRPHAPARETRPGQPA